MTTTTEQPTMKVRASRAKKATEGESWSDSPERAEKNGQHLRAMESTEPKQISGISLPRLNIQSMELMLVGDSPLICHRWSEKAKKEMLDKQMGKASSGKAPKDPEQDYRESLYVIAPAPAGEPFENGTFGFPTIAFKNAAVTACTSLGKSVTKVAARQAFHVMGELATIIGRPRMREDMVRVGMGTADIRFRGEFPEWAVKLWVRFNAHLLTAEQVMNLFSTAGFAVGVGEWRSERDGSFGLFHVASEEEGRR